jgi:hypothetical protein
MLLKPIDTMSDWPPDTTSQILELGSLLKFPKYSCSVCGKPSSRKWNLYRHISNCHAGIGNCVSNWDFPKDAYGVHWNRWEKRAINQKEKSHYILPDLLKDLSSNESNDRKPFDYQHVFKEALFKELAKMAVSTIQPTQSWSSRISYEFISVSNEKLQCASCG